MKKEKIYLKALKDNKLVDIDLDTIKKEIFKDIDPNKWTYLFTIKFFSKDVPTPIIRKESVEMLDGSYDEADYEEFLGEILDVTNHLSETPIYAITKQAISEKGIICTNDDKEIYAIRDTDGAVLKEFLIKF